MATAGEVKNYRRQVYQHPDTFIQKMTDKVMSENRDNPERDFIGVDHLQQIIAPTGLPSPFIYGQEKPLAIDSEKIKNLSL